MKKFFVSAMLAVLLASLAQADVIVVKNNDTRIVGFVQELGDELIVTIPSGTIKVYPKSMAERIISDEELLKEFNGKLAQTTKTDINALSALASWAKRNGLAEKMRQTYKTILTIDPNNIRARQRLGHIKKGDKWFAPLTENAEALQKKGYTIYDGKRWVLDFSQKDKWNFTEEEIKKHSTFENAWTILSPHYILKTNAPPKTGAELMTLLEEVCAQFYKVFGKDFDMKPVRVPMIVNIYATQNGYNRYAVGRWGRQAIGTTGFFFAQERNLTTFIQPSLKAQLMHEGFHQLMYHTVYVTSTSGKSASTWVHEGIARYFQNSEWKNGKVTRTGGRNKRDMEIIQKSLSAGKYPRLKEFVSKSFTHAKFNQFFAVCYAMSSSYVEFLLNYENAKYRKGFCKYFETVRKMDESVENFEKAMGGKKVDDLQKEWEAWLKKSIAKEKIAEQAKKPEDKNIDKGKK